ncbi:hypothetical protein LshimejAT787_0109410 [Lyophyllum shimeji]|uniref:INO80 complex subunit F domain-containing protein n=1 Tax=Lyophyllum shimeji TaxID=47721 RepID=A0A9P3PDU4_LYOSH|nr:hypothetical protein LshimejAT787_0109410 [Lyophyllum shimeji]
MSAHPSPGPSTQSVSSRHKQKPYVVGIAAGAEDAKYQAKYKDLKRKVKEIETDNDKLHFKVLQAKRNIQRMKLERAILYERLASTPTQNDLQNRHGGPTPMHSGSGGPTPPFSRTHSGSHHYQDVGDNHASMDSERSLTEYGHPHDRSRMPSGPDGRSVPVMAPMGPGVAPPAHMSGMHSPPARNSGGPGHETSRHMQHLPPPPPPGNHAHSRPHVSPNMHHSHSGSSHEHTRSHSSSRSRSHQQSYLPGHPQQYPEGLPSVQHVMHSPPLAERERSGRHDNHEALNSYGDPHQHNRLSSFMPRLSPPPHPSESRSSSRVHNHRRMSPGPYMNREDPYDRQRATENERERDWEREREREREYWDREHDRDRSRDLGRSRDVSSSHMVSPPMGHRSRQPMDRTDYSEPHGSSHMRDEPVYYRDAPPAAGGYPMHSRSGSPISGSGSGSGNAGDGPSRPDSRHYYEQHDRTRAYKLRPVNPPNEDMDFVHEDGQPASSRDRGGGGGGTFPAPEQNRSSLDSRKRRRNEMDVDSDDAGEGSAYPGGRAIEDRGKRYHREHRRSVDNLEEARMVPP